MVTTTDSLMELDPLCNEVLTGIEFRESRLLNWGFVDVRSNLQADLPEILSNLPEVAQNAWILAQQAGITTEVLVKNLEERKLIFRVAGGYHRSRFAEAVRLLYLLRQRFSPDDWNTASRLVSDLRINLQRRRYPRRDVSLGDLRTSLVSLNLTEAHLQAIDHLLAGPDGPMQLARFQQEAIAQQFRNLQERGDRALVIGAGTGAGKTKAFYVPAMADLAATMTPGHWVRVLALYPRVELLKDQLAEAFSEVRKLDGFLTDRRKRIITLGAYYGDTPRSAQALLDYGWAGWIETRGKDAYICPYLSCPNSECSRGELAWPLVDIRLEAEANTKQEYGRYARLRCLRCGYEISGEQLLLTRDRLTREPPDILFTTTEMLNRRLSRSREHALFGVDTPNPPRLMLLDEIHTYEGITGAQVAYLLRRWRHARGYKVGRNLCLVGLSATLTQAEEFFSKLTGIPLYNVGYITPREKDLVDEGLEYNLLVKGDPVSGTSLLSTSVQSVMLLSRMLDPRTRGMGSDAHIPSRGAIGHKIFAFTDKLDVTNRWFHIEREVEQPERGRPVLAQLRQLRHDMDGVTRRLREQQGQLWIAAEDIGHNLSAGLNVELTSSQYRGVSPTADLVIATSTLEVGFNDPEVGAVVQHKAPRSMPSLLQRKGRAGRTRAMRPWMLVVTSEYGRDRWAFQHAETLFDPVLPPIDLPVDNYYVRKIQATYALMDWVCQVLGKQNIHVDVWDALSSGDLGKNWMREEHRPHIARLLETVLTGARLEEFSSFLQRALGITEEERGTVIPLLLWGEPRSILFEVIPTILRQLGSGWQRIVNGKARPWDDNISRNPMPDFVPPNLFMDISVPELLLHMPNQQLEHRGPVRGYQRAGSAGSPQGSMLVQSVGTGQAVAGTEVDASGTVRDGNSQNASIGKDESIMLHQGMTEFAPGNVSKRYARPTFLDEAHWLPLPDDAQLSRNALPLQYLGVYKDEVPRVVSVDGTEYQVYRPRAYTLQNIPREVKSTSKGWLTWRSHFEPRCTRLMQRDNEAPEVGTADPRAAATSLQLAKSSPWRRFFKAARAYTQGNGAWVDVTRLATGVRVNTLYSRGTEKRRTLAFEENDGPAALGYTISVDALEFQYEQLDVSKLMEGSDWPYLYRALGPRYFLYKFAHDLRVTEAELNSFEIGWIWQLEFSMLVATAVARRCTLIEAAEEVDRLRDELTERTLNVIFQSLQIEEQESEEHAGRLHKKLVDLMGRPALRDALRDSERVLWERDDPGLPAWLDECYASSLGSALFAALTRLVPDIDPDDLSLDIGQGTIWISEAVAGGVGLVSGLADVISQYPRDLDLELLDTVQSCDREALANHLSSIAHLVDSGYAPLQEAFSRVRQIQDIPRQEATRRLLTRALEDAGVPASRELVVSLNAKFLRPNSGTDTDELLCALVNHWEAEEERLGCAIDLRVIAVAARKIDEVNGHLTRVLDRINGPGQYVPESQVFNILQSLLWLPCLDSCPDCIEKSGQFQDLIHPSRLLLWSLLSLDGGAIEFRAPGWEEQVSRALEERYSCGVECKQENLAECKLALTDLLTTPIEVGFQLFYPVVERITRSGTRWRVDLALRELLQN
jgi:hypothetical protein